MQRMLRGLDMTQLARVLGEQLGGMVGEDRCRGRGLAAIGLARLRGFAINCLRGWGLSNRTAALEGFAARPFE